MLLAVVRRLIAAQEAANLSNGALARAMGISPSTVSRYKSGEAEPSLHVAEAWARACGADLSVAQPLIVAVEDLAMASSDLRREELVMVETAVQALLTTRADPERRAVVVAALGLVAGQVQHKGTAAPPRPV